MTEGNRTGRSSGRLGNAFLNLVLVAAALLVCEGLLHAGAAVSDRVYWLTSPPSKTAFVDDPVLGYRGDSRFADHDAWGFRNARRPDRAAVLALGDSNTYGESVAREEAWPAVLGAALGRPVYNMGVSDYGPLQSAAALDQGLALAPRVVVLALYLGNDYLDAFNFAKRQGRVAALVDAPLARSALDREAAGSVVDAWARLSQIAYTGEARPLPGAGALAAVPGLWSEVRRWIAAHSRMGALVRRAYLVIASPPAPRPPLLIQRDFAKTNEAIRSRRLDCCLPLHVKFWRTTVIVDYLHDNMDDEDPRVRAGEAMTLAAIEGIDRRARGAGARLLVALVPIKPAVFGLHVEIEDVHHRIAELIRREERLKMRLLARLDALKVPAIDLGPALAAAEEMPYFGDVDEHPNSIGQRAIAAAIGTRLAALGLP
ncbi:MAG: hypothetical protein FJX67_09385 [Alphaproteobacteria bacterium]|nr:hypothetical protein [Alphaproteobacteria bacterium]